ncbi:MAG: DegT/DnrJ/EryC1/StrS aminotransferase family protein [Bacteroidales bacterium]|nr:DegT/DnrJ/EryC1/StrS aminotransferase family protein [Bacteroidales bacterium]
MIPFSPPRIDNEIIEEVTSALQSGWITTGPRTKQFEEEITVFCGNKKTLAVSSATAGLELVLRWFGVKQGDEVILPVYTYCATANVIMHCGATPVMVDTNSDDFNINIENIRKAITSKTKVIIPVDFAGLPCDYSSINNLVKEKDIIANFIADNDIQKKLGRILVLSDAAHSIGAQYENKMTGNLTDITVFSFHAVKNLTTAEGGAICFNLSENFDHEAIYKYFNTISLHGQSKDALAKTQKGNWKYDVVEPGYKANMTDILASIGLIELRRYSKETLQRRKQIFQKYQDAFKNYTWAQLPIFEDARRESSYHIFPLRIKNVTEEQRNTIIQGIFDKDVSVNVHFQPLSNLTAYKNLGYCSADYPIAFDNYSREISLPVYFDLQDKDLCIVIDAVVNSVKEVLG